MPPIVWKNGPHFGTSKAGGGIDRKSKANDGSGQLNQLFDFIAVPAQSTKSMACCGFDERQPPVI